MNVDETSALQALTGGAPARQRRARSQLSCTHCRQGKLKCNRDTPCDQCIKRNRETACNYLPPPQKSKAGQNVKARINHLEHLVVELIKSKDDPKQPAQAPFAVPATVAAASLTPPHDTHQNEDPIAQSSRESPESDQGGYGSITIANGETSYVSGSHWTAILDSISDLKQHLGDDENGTITDIEATNEEDADIYDDSPEGISFLLRSPPRKSKAELIQSMPPRDVANRLLFNFLNSPDPFKVSLHPPTFQEEYKEFWRNPTKTPTMWIAILFGIFSLSCGHMMREVNAPESPLAKQIYADVLRYHELAASAASLGDYTSPKPYAIEALLFYAAGLVTRKSFVDVWQLLGVAIRVALRMGYHRDGRYFKSLTPFQSEMRRRSWHSLYMIDVLLSFQMGQPSMLRMIQSDTARPGNYHDYDLSVDMKVLPPSRPDTEVTPMTYANTKATLFPVFADIVELSHITIPPSYDQIMTLDRRLDEAIARMPSLLQLKALDESLAVNSETLMWRYNLALLALKSRIVLHRRFMKVKADSPFYFSRKACVSAAAATMRYHHEIYWASMLDGQLKVPKWYMASVSTHDFLLSAMILCVELAQHCGMTVNGEAGAEDNDFVIDQQEIISLLAMTQKIWEENVAEQMAKSDLPQPSVVEAWRSKLLVSDTAKAARALSIMIAKVKARNASLTAPSTSTGTSNSTPGLSMPHTTPENWTEPAITQEDWLTAGVDQNFMDYTMLDDMIDVPDGIDWELWDKISTGQTAQATLPAHGAPFPDWSLENTTSAETFGGAFANVDLSGQ